MKYFVEIVKYDREETVVKHMGPMGYHKAIRVNNGANRNLDHNNYFTRIVDSDGIETS